MNDYRLMPLDERKVHAEGSGCTAETFMKAYGTIMQGDSSLFSDFMAEWQNHASASYLMIPRDMPDVGFKPLDYLSHKRRSEVKIVLIFEDLSVAICGDNGGVATDVQSMMSDWWTIGNRIFQKHIREHDPDLS